MPEVLDPANDYNLDIKRNRHHFKYESKMVVTDKFIINMEINPGLWTYQSIKKFCSLDPCLYLVRETLFRNAIAQMRKLTYLGYWTWRHTRPKTPVQEILCKSCGVTEDKAHFILSCHKKTKLYGRFSVEYRIYVKWIQKRDWKWTGFFFCF